MALQYFEQLSSFFFFCCDFSYDMVSILEVCGFEHLTRFTSKKLKIKKYVKRKTLDTHKCSVYSRSTNRYRIYILFY